MQLVFGLLLLSLSSSLSLLLVFVLFLSLFFVLLLVLLFLQLKPLGHQSWLYPTSFLFFFPQVEAKTNKQKRNKHSRRGRV